jgi:alkanesulfonate monooxygenase SsuD/methylene tetrahydromethanopterin reductase-like flavin-dependent oxidoreductase (luciferase family)
VVPDVPGFARDAKLAEEQGFTHVDVSLTGFVGNPYAGLALAATATRRVKLGTSIAAASLRSAPATVHSIATRA